MPQTNLEKFQQLLRELFQFDCADLDFGIYRIMNYKRDVIDKFITQDLPEKVTEELERDKLAEQSEAAREMEEVAGQISETLGSDAIDADGNLAEPYHNTPLGRKYLSLKERTADGRGRATLEATIYNHLYTFFSRYYQDGDFISKRRYSKRQKYAIPYNGEEVYLYWANHDQYYVKTAEHFHDYTFTSHGVTVHFKLKAADVEQNNVKGEKRFFIPHANEISWNEDTSELVIPFEYRPLTKQETITFGTKDQQSKIIEEAGESISKKLTGKERALLALNAERRIDGDGRSVSYLEHHLRQYTRRHTSDFFIHKDLKGFLSRELDFYLKNEVLNLDEMERAGEDLTDGWFQITRIIKSIGRQIVEFLNQIESFQKKLWEKRKFIVKTQYCIAVGILDERFYPEIANCDNQWLEWDALFHLAEDGAGLFEGGDNLMEKRIAFLRSNPLLMVDTRHYTNIFIEELLGSISKLDEKVDGLLINSDNWQALNLLQLKYRGRIGSIYIDPPYNSPSSEILYKNNYKHSSWMTLMNDRIKISKTLQTENGSLVIAIDDNEITNLKNVISLLYGKNIESVVVRSNPAGRSTPKGFSLQHEYAIFVWNNGNDNVSGRLQHTEKQANRYKESDAIGPFEWVNFRKHGGLREESPKMYYPIFINELNFAWRIPTTKWNNEKEEWELLEQPKNNETVLWPNDDQGQARRWKWSVERLKSSQNETKVRLDKNKVISLYIKARIPTGGVTPPTWWDKKYYSATDWGTRTLKNLFGELGVFDYPKAVDLVKDCLLVGNTDKSDIILDYFAGSGTTGHAVINLNRQDGGSRKFILVEMEKYFETVLLPRLKKIAFTSEWKSGKPQKNIAQSDLARGPRIIKYIHLENYEDTLSNIRFRDDSEQLEMKFSDYLLEYILDNESRESETLLRVDKLKRPFNYKLQIHQDGQTREKAVDIPETFNYMIGLHVDTRKVYNNDGRRYVVYRGRIDHKVVVVIWRDTETWQEEDLKRDREFILEQGITEGADEIYVNGDSYIPRATALEPVFKARMFAKVEGD